MVPLEDGARRLVLVTGASGFVGSALCDALPAAGFAVRRAVRTARSSAADDAVVGTIDDKTDWSAALRRVDAIVHLAARTHVIDETALDPLAEYRRINVLGTRALAAQARAAGVRQFVFMSSIKVNGERTESAPFTEADDPSPEDAYGVTKLEAEAYLRDCFRADDTRLAILRPPLVYGPGVKGNFLRLMRLVARGVPLPLKSIDNRRSLIYVENLVDVVVTSLLREANGTYLVSDGEQLSTPQLVRALAAALGRRPVLLAFPQRVLEGLGAVSGKSEQVKRLTGSLAVDSSLVRQELGWQPPYTLAHGLAETARWYHSQLGARSTVG